MPPTAARMATLCIAGPDRKGIVAACTEILNRHGCGIVQSEHYTDRQYNMFFQRMQFDYHRLDTTHRASTDAELQEVAQSWNLTASIDWRLQRKQVALMVSKSDHCLWELLLRHQAHELECDIPLVISNHPDLAHVAETFHVPFHVISVSSNDRYQHEPEQLTLLRDYRVDTVVLARYMQILSTPFLQAFPHNIINIHHSFLPAFRGGRAYHQAHARGVKLIGATVCC
jgi:formyltetrahydrofolate deformylase